MSAGETGRGVTEFYGSWTFNLPITSNGVVCQRPVRMVLVEQIEGVDLQSSLIHNDYVDYRRIDAFHLPEDYRLQVLARILEIHARCLHLGVDHGDLVSRNVMLATDTSAELSTGHNTIITIPRVVLVDFNVSAVYSGTTLGKHYWGGVNRPANPLEVCWHQCLAVNFEGWTPREWEDSHRLQQQWLLERFGSEEHRAIYEPVTNELEFTKDWLSSLT